MSDDQSINFGTDINSAAALKTFIQNKSCVLLLGPLFATDPGGKKIHQLLRMELARITPPVDIDDEFDNLYISRDNTGVGNAFMYSSIMNFYNSSARNNIYDVILTIGFRAIINFSADSYLSQADATNAYNSSYFSSKPKPADADEQPANFDTGKPVIYNLFGDINDYNSLATDYDSLYDFLISLLKADQELPLRLKDILSNATAFLMLGFDLSKWYVPLIMRKLSQFILKGARNKSAVNAFATLNDTPLGVTPAVLASLNKYPFRFVEFKKMKSEDLLNQLGLVAAATLNGNGHAHLPPQAQNRGFFEKWLKDLDELPRDEGLPTFFYELSQLNYAGKFQEGFSFQKLNFTDSQDKKFAGRLKPEDFIVTYQNVKAEVQSLIKELLRS